MNRRNFLRNSALGGLVTYSTSFPISLLTDSALFDPEIMRLTILHTNDVHSRVEPFPDDGSRNAGMGGAARRATLIRKIREEVDHVLLLDAGDIFQGTPYFNYFGGELEMRLMSEMGYDAATIGNHDFDNSIDGLEEQLVNAKFPLLSSNYDFSDTVLNGKVENHLIKPYGNIKVGVFGLGIELDGLVPKHLYKETQYLDPILKAKESVSQLKEMGCDYIIALSHLGYRYREDKISDYALAEATSDIDLIIGGHTHTFLNEPVVVTNADGGRTVINQVGFAGIMLGRLDITFERNKKGKCIYCSNTFIK